MAPPSSESSAPSLVRSCLAPGSRYHYWNRKSKMESTGSRTKSRPRAVSRWGESEHHWGLRVSPGRPRFNRPFPVGAAGVRGRSSRKPPDPRG